MMEMEPLKPIRVKLINMFKNKLNYYNWDQPAFANIRTREVETLIVELATRLVCMSCIHCKQIDVYAINQQRR